MELQLMLFMELPGLVFKVL